MRRHALEVIDAGMLTTVQDLGRPGWAHVGVPRSGALDRRALQRANALVGNPEDLASLETTATGCVLRALVPLVVAVAGARCHVRVGSVPAPWGAPMRVAAGQVLTVGPALDGLRSYVAVRGGVQAPAVLGSRASDLLTGTGPSPLAGGDRLDVGDPGDAPEPAFGARASDPPIETLTLAVLPGPRADWFTAEAVSVLTGSTYTVSHHSNRVGLRLEGPALQRWRDSELASEPLIPGAVQVPAAGTPVVFLADHPTTGGYPVIAVVTASSLDDASQAPPGAAVRFRMA